MISTKIRSGRVSAVYASASKPSVAVITLQPAFSSRVSAVRRMVLLSSMTMIFRFSRFTAIASYALLVNMYEFFRAPGYYYRISAYSGRLDAETRIGGVARAYLSNIVLMFYLHTST